MTRTGNQKHYQARRDSPIFEELHGLVVKTIGLAGPLRKALEHQAEAVRAALSDSLRYADLFEARRGAEAVLGRTINPTVMTAAQWRTKRARADSFAARVASQPRVFVIRR